MGRFAPHPLALKFYLAFNAAALLGAAALMTELARGSSFSGQRLILIGLTTAMALAVAAAALVLHLKPAQERRLTRAVPGPTRALGIALTVSFLVFWCLTWFPPQYMGSAYYYFIGLYPLILCGLLATGSALVYFLVASGGASSEWWLKYFHARRPALIIALLALAAFGLVALLTTQLRILHGLEPFWYGAGVPILAAQVLMAAVVAALALHLENWRGTKSLPADVFLFIVIWAAAAALWASRPVPASYWVTAPRAPNFEYYPFSDLITYDIASQFALIGQGIFNRMYFDRALYMSFLTYLHTVGGQNYQQLMAIQAAVFAVLPALLYLVGRQLHSRPAGLVLAALIILRGLASLDASAWIDTATFKHMLTDFPTAIGVAGFLVLILKWMKAPRERVSSLLWAGGILGLTSLLRPHVLLLMAGTVLLALWLYRPDWRRALGNTALVSLAFVAAVLPWTTLGTSSGSLLTQYGGRLEAVIAQRFPRATETAAPSPRATAVVSTPVPPATSVASSPAPPATSAAASPAVTSESAVPTRKPSTYTPPADPGLPFFADHFLHNLVTSAMIFPDTLQLLSVRGVVKEGEAFWRPRWDGSMSALPAALLVLSLAVLAYGIGLAIQRDRGRGFTPIAVFLLYVAANSFARTSGGRYIVPVDWILVVYFSIAVAELARALDSVLRRRAIPELAEMSEPSRVPHRGGSARKERRTTTVKEARRPSSPVSRSLGILFILLLLGGLVPLAGVLYAPRYAPARDSTLLEELQRYVPPAGGAEDLEVFLQQPDAVIVQGRLLYPLYYPRNEGEPTRHAPYTAREYPRTVFMLIGRHGMLHVLLPGGKPALMPNASDAIVLGCRRREQNYNVIHALAVALPAQQTGLERSPAAPLDCPLPEPICDNNGNCY